MAKVEIYYWSTCPYCRKARETLEEQASEYIGYDITGDNDARDKMVERTGGPRSVPQIFINDEHIGGCDDLLALNDSGKLTELLAS